MIHTSALAQAIAELAALACRPAPPASLALRRAVAELASAELVRAQAEIARQPMYVRRAGIVPDRLD